MCARVKDDTAKWSPHNESCSHIALVGQGLCHNMYPEMIDTMNATRNVNLTLNWKPKNRSLTMANPEAYN